MNNVRKKIEPHLIVTVKKIEDPVGKKKNEERRVE